MIELAEQRQHDAEAQRKALSEALEIAKKASLQKTLFLANISHELRTPLNGILGMARLLMDAEDRDARQNYTSMLVHSGEALLEIVNDILDFSKVEAGHLELERRQLDVWRMVEGVARILHLGAARGEVEIELSIDPRVPRWLYGDEIRLRQVLMNFCGNATKFTQAGVVRIDVDLRDERLRMSVSDTGCGIREDALDGLFEPFTQADGSMTRRFGGTGLGLAICDRLVELMGGEIGARSTWGKGSVFWFEVPYEACTGAAETAPLFCDFATCVIPDPATRREILAHLRAAGCDIENVDPAQPGRRGESPQFFLFDTRAGSPATWRPAVADEDHVLLLVDRDPEVAAAWQATFPAATRLLRPILPSNLMSACRAAPQPSSPEDAPGPGHDLRGYRVLVVDDNRINNCFAGALLTKMGCDVAAVCSGVEALEILELRDFDAVLMDCQMPELDGYETTARIRARQQDGPQRIYIIALTAHAMPEDRERCLAAGMDDYLAKPLQPGELDAALARSRKHALAAE